MLTRRAILGFVLLLGTLPSSAQTIFSDGFECGDVVAWSAPNPEEPAVAGMTCEHNEARERINAGAVPGQPAASPPIPMMTWSPELASVAQAWVENCVWAHNSNRSSQAGLGVYVGENLFASTSGGLASSSNVVNAWFVEHQDYDYDANSCNGVCGHYTQVIWRSSTLVGCGHATCTTGSPWGSGTWHFVACDYAEGGNWPGQKPY